MDVFLRTDELKEAVFALKEYRIRARRARMDNYEWKWALLAIHNAMQGFMVCALRGTSGLNVLKKEIAREWIRAHRAGEELPQEEMDYFLALYKKIKSKMMLQFEESSAFAPSGTQTSSVKKLNRWRNKFIHYLPCHWSIDVRDLPALCGDVLDVIYFLNNSINIDFVTSDESVSRESVNVILDHAFSELFELSMEYEAG